MTGQDGRVYPNGEAPDLGSITAISNVNGVREYRLLNTDLTKLQNNVKYCGTGSTAFVVDTGAVYMFHDADKTWHAI